MGIDEHTSKTEARGWGLVTSLETSRGFSLSLTNKRSGFNGLSVSKSGDVRKIEVKTINKSDRWFAVNGLHGIERLFLDRDYWIYFALLPENVVIATHAVPFLRKQVRYNHADLDLSAELKEWIDLTKRRSREFGLRFVPRIHLNVRVPMRRLLKQVLDNPRNPEWHPVVAEIWGNKGKWHRLFRSPEEPDEDEY
jgi:hypothetical protein